MFSMCTVHTQKGVFGTVTTMDTRGYCSSTRVVYGLMVAVVLGRDTTWPQIPSNYHQIPHAADSW